MRPGADAGTDGIAVRGGQVLQVGEEGIRLSVVAAVGFVFAVAVAVAFEVTRKARLLFIWSML